MDLTMMLEVLKEHALKTGRVFYASPFELRTGSDAGPCCLKSTVIPFTVEHLIIEADREFTLYDVRCGAISLIQAYDGAPSRAFSLRGFDLGERLKKENLPGRTRLDFDFGVGQTLQLIGSAEKPVQGTVILLGARRPLRRIEREMCVLIDSVGMTTGGPAVEVRSRYYDSGESLRARILVTEEDLPAWMEAVGKSAYVTVSLSAKSKLEGGGGSS